MEHALHQVLTETSEIDSEIHRDEKSEVLGVLAADQEGLCLLSQGSIEPSLAGLSSNLAKLSKKLEPGQEVPTIILDSNKTKLIIKQEDEVVVAILKKSK